MVGDSPPLMSEELVKNHKIIKQTDSGFGVDAQADPGGPLRALTRLARQGSPT